MICALLLNWLTSKQQQQQQKQQRKKGRALIEWILYRHGKYGSCTCGRVSVADRVVRDRNVQLPADCTSIAASIHQRALRFQLSTAQTRLAYRSQIESQLAPVRVLYGQKRTRDNYLIRAKAVIIQEFRMALYCTVYRLQATGYVHYTLTLLVASIYG